jgi:hypothetical protein
MSRPSFPYQFHRQNKIYGRPELQHTAPRCTICSSRCYGRTAALRLLVQPSDVFSPPFLQVMEHRRNEIDRGKPKYSGEKPVPVPLCPPQIPHGLTRDRNRASAVGDRRLTAWAMARPYLPITSHGAVFPLNHLHSSITDRPSFITTLLQHSYVTCRASKERLAWHVTNKAITSRRSVATRTTPR